MVKMKDLKLATATDLHQVREVWYNTLYDFPSAGREFRIVGDVRLVGVYRVLKSAKVAKRRAEEKLRNMMEEKDSDARKRMFVRHMIKESMCAPARYGAAIFSYSCAVTELTEVADQTFWNIPPEARGNPSDIKLLVRDPDDSNLVWEYPSGKIFKNERTRIL